MDKGEKAKVTVTSPNRLWPRECDMTGFTVREFLKMWHKRRLGDKDGNITFWWSEVIERHDAEEEIVTMLPAT